MKKLGLLILVVMLMITVGCGSEKNIAGNLEDLMTKVYGGIKDEDKPMMLMNIPIDNENIEYYLGTSDIEYESALASESGVGSIAHSVVLVRVKENVSVDKVKASIKENINPRKWVCVGVEEDKVIVDSIGDLIIVIMDNNYPDKLHENFKNLK